MTQTTIKTNSEATTREISEEEYSDLLLQLFYLREAGEDIKIETNACYENSWRWTEMTVYRNLKRGLVITKFNR